MKLIKKVGRIEVKRCFVLSNRFTSKKLRKRMLKKKMIPPTRVSLTRDLVSSRKAVLRMKESSLDEIIFTEYRKRLKAFNNFRWFVGYADLTEVGLWREAGGLPKKWTIGSLKDSADRLSRELKKKSSKYSRIRAMKTVPEIIRLKRIIKKEKYMLPIILPGGTVPDCRKGMQQTKGNIIDGCMRSLAFAVSGDKKLKAYIGVKN